jgi:hypothetical protein
LKSSLPRMLRPDDEKENRDSSMTAYFHFSMAPASSQKGRYPFAFSPGSRIRSGMDLLGARLMPPCIFFDLK